MTTEVELQPDLEKELALRAQVEERLDSLVKPSNGFQQFDTGAVRDTQDGKTRYDLLSPQLLKRTADHMTRYAAHYGEHNWTKGIPSSRYMASLLRHVEAYRAGQRDEDHLAAAVFNLMGIMRNEGTDLDDLFEW